METYTFQNPEQIYRGIDLWMVNDKLEDDEIVHQVHEFKDKGLGTVIFRTYNGLISDYPGENFKHSVRVAVDAAKECGLRIVLQAGFMPAAIPELPEKYTLHRIFPVKKDSAVGNETVLAQHGDTLYTDTIVPAALNMLDPDAVDYYILKNYEEMWSEFKDEFGKTITSVWVDEPRFENKYLVWMPDFEELFMEKYGYSLKENLISLYHNEGDYKKVRYDYYTFLRDRMENCYYSKIQSWCHKNSLLSSGHLMGEERLHTQISQAIAIMPFYKYFDIPGFDMLRCTHDWHDKPLKHHVDNINAEAKRSMDVASVQCVSAAHQAEKNHILCEMYGVTSPSLGFRDQMHLFDFFASTGVNCQCMHALFYSPRGFRKRFYPQTFNVYQPFWGNFRSVKDYVARVSNFISEGKSATDILVLHPLETAYGLYCGLSDTKDESARNDVIEYDMKFYKFITDLQSMQIPFHLGDIPTIDSIGCIKNGKFTVGNMSYKTVVLSDIEVLSETTLNLLCEFAKCGGTILINGSLPERIDGLASSAPNVLSSFENINVFKDRGLFISEIAKNSSSVFECNDDVSEIMINHNTDEGKHYFMIYNGDCRKAKKGSVVIEGIHNAYSFDAHQNKVSKIYCFEKEGKTYIPVKLPIGGSVLIFTKPANSALAYKENTKKFSVMPIENLICNVEEDNVLTLDLCTYKTENMADYSIEKMDIEHTVEALKKADYTGKVSLRFTFYTDFCTDNLKLVIENPKDCTITLNGKIIQNKDIGYYYSKAYRMINLPDYIKNGENVIEIERFYTPQRQAPVRDDMKHLFDLFRAPIGVDLERIHLVGDFKVKTFRERSFGAGLIRLSDKMIITSPSNALTDAADLTSCGYPFYPGTVRYSASINCNEDILTCSDIILKIGECSCCNAEVFINDKKAGNICRDPFTLSVKEFLTTGKNKIDIRICGTFRNMIGPSHSSYGDLSGCNPNLWILPMNEHSEDPNVPQVTNSYMLTPYGISDVQLELH